MHSTNSPESFAGPVFLVGCPRSGTTLLQRILDAHSAIAVAPETHFIRRFWLQRSQFGDLGGEDGMNRLVGSIIAMPEFSEMGIHAEKWRAAALSGERSYPAVLHQLLSCFAERHGASVVGEKTPNHLLYMRTLECWFPEARFVHIVRDPRAVVCSWRDVPWSTGRVDGDAMVWRRYMATARRNPPRNRQSILTIRYEDLILSPETTVESICRFLGVGFEPAMMSFHDIPTNTVNVAREPWKVAATRPIDRTSLDRWRSELSSAAVARIEAAAWPEMKRWSYPPETGALRRSLIASWSRPAELVHRLFRITRRWL